MVLRTMAALIAATPHRCTESTRESADAPRARPGVCIIHAPCGYDVKMDFFKQALLGASLSATLVLSGCAASAAKDFSGRWKPVNHFQNTPTEIPIAKTYTFYAAPMDGTLKAMLARWAKDSNLQLSYLLQSDFALYTPVAQVRTADIQDAVARLNTLYAAQDVFVTADNRRIQVRSAHAARVEAAATTSTTATPASVHTMQP